MTGCGQYLTERSGMWPPSSRPECVILAGPNGGGKSTIYKTIRFSGAFVNADDIARRLKPEAPEAVGIFAGRLVLAELEQLIEARSDFVYETTLSSHQSVRLIKQACKQGYAVLLIFVVLQTAEMHVLRVKQRVRQGGHDIPETHILRRYEKSLHNLALCPKFCDHLQIYDNSWDTGPRLLLELTGGRLKTDRLGKSALDQRVARVMSPFLK